MPGAAGGCSKLRDQQHWTPAHQTSVMFEGRAGCFRRPTTDSSVSWTVHALYTSGFVDDAMFAICTVARCRRRQEEVCTQWQIQKIVLGRGRRGSGGLDPTFINIFGPLTAIAPPHGSATVCPLPLLPSYWKGLGVFGIGRNAERKMRDPLRWLSAGFIRAESYTCCLTESRSVCGVQSGGRLGTTTATTFSWSPCGARRPEQTHTLREIR